MLVNPVHAKSGGSCEYIEYNLLAKINSIATDNLLVNEHSDPTKAFEISIKQLTFIAKKNDFVWVVVREHSSGGCSPFAVQKIIPFEILNIDFNPGDKTAYQVAFALAELKSCTLIPGCIAEEQNSAKLAPSTIIKLRTLLPRTIATCSIEVMKATMETIQKSLPSPDIVACIKDESDNERLLELAVIEADGNPMVLLEIH